MNKSEYNCFFVSDLHGDENQYDKLFRLIEKEKPDALFFGGDILPSMLNAFTNDTHTNFITDFLMVKLRALRAKMLDAYPGIFLILGNDDPMADEKYLHAGEVEKLWKYIHNKKVRFGDYKIYGYSYIPPSPLLLKDWERYDVSRYVDPGCVSPEEGYRSVKLSLSEIQRTTIKNDLNLLTNGEDDFSRGIFLFHSPPYKCKLDRAALDGKYIDHVPLDVHVGSIAIREFIENKKPLLTLHGHIHESTRLTGSWRDRIKTTEAFNAANDSGKLALVRFQLPDVTQAERELY